MKFTIFYSWQSDLPNSTNRGFIDGELKALAREFSAEGAVVVEVDRDTSGLSGAPDIGKAILEKIDAADAFVADVSIMNPQAQEERRTPNPNVLFELGWAFRALGHERVLMVMNVAFGGLADLPFDLKQRRTVQYDLADAVDKTLARKSLRDQLRRAIRAVLEVQRRTNLPAAPVVVDRAASVLDAIRTSRPSQDVEAERFVQRLAEDLDRIDPHSLMGSQSENLLKAIDETATVVNDFGRVAEVAAAEKAEAAVHGLVKGMEHLLKRYRPQRAGTHTDSDFDLFKFVGHELLAILAGHLTRAERWRLVASLFSETIHSDDPVAGVRSTGISRLSADPHLLRMLSREKQRFSIHADLLKKRHEDNPPIGGLSFEDFLAGDLILWLGTFGGSQFAVWSPRSALYLEGRVPRFLLAATLTFAGANALTAALGKKNPHEMKELVTRALSSLETSFAAQGTWDFWSFDANQIRAG